MSQLSTIRDALVTAINTALTSTHVTATKFSGDEKAMSGSVPAVYLQWIGRQDIPKQILGTVKFRRVGEVFIIRLVCDDGSTTDGEDYAATSLDLIRAALNDSQTGGTGNRCTPFSGLFEGGMSESLMSTHGGRYMYGQAWLVEHDVNT